MSQLVVIELDMLKQMINEVVAHVLKAEQPQVAQNKLVYTTSELAIELRMHEQKINQLRQLHALKGIKKGKEYIYTHEEVMEFLRKYNGKDISNEQKIMELVRKNYLENEKSVPATRHKNTRGL